MLKSSSLSQQPSCFVTGMRAFNGLLGLAFPPFLFVCLFIVVVDEGRKNKVRKTKTNKQTNKQNKTKQNENRKKTYNDSIIAISGLMNFTCSSFKYSFQSLIVNICKISNI